MGAVEACVDLHSFAARGDRNAGPAQRTEQFAQHDGDRGGDHDEGDRVADVVGAHHAGGDDQGDERDAGGQHREQVPPVALRLGKAGIDHTGDEFVHHPDRPALAALGCEREPVGQHQRCGCTGRVRHADRHGGGEGGVLGCRHGAIPSEDQAASACGSICDGTGVSAHAALTTGAFADREREQLVRTAALLGAQVEFADVSRPGTQLHDPSMLAAALMLAADIVVAAVGRPEMVRGHWLKPGCTVIDVGINRGEDGKLCGDVDFASASQVAGAITPVPGGVGPMTIACLLANTYSAACRANNLQPEPLDA